MQTVDVISKLTPYIPVAVHSRAAPSRPRQGSRRVHRIMSSRNGCLQDKKQKNPLEGRVHLLICEGSALGVPKDG